MLRPMASMLLRALTLTLLAPLLYAAPTAAATAAATPGADRAAAALPPRPATSRPPAGVHGHPLWDSWHTLKPFGYRQQELLVSGTARAEDGTTAPYTTRVVVFRPKEEADFNGTVLLDWVNVTAQFENPVDILEARELLLREGYAFVHVSAQAAGLCCTPLTPKVWDPQRYAAISHPGDAYAGDMFAQVARLFRDGPATGPDPMAGLRVRRVLASGQSQSANQLHDFVTARQGAGVIDGFLIHGEGAKTFDVDLDVPVLHLLSDREADPAPPGDDPNYSLWEVAATAHSDYFIGYQQVHGSGRRVADQPALDREGYDDLIHAAGNYGQDPAPLQTTCTVAGATMPMHYATSSALFQLDRWVRTGERPRTQPRYAFDDTGSLARDEHGNTRGGIRLPPVEVPVATYVSTSCNLGGITIPFTDPQVQSLYPTFAGYQRRMRAATDRAVRQGWLLRADARDQMRRVCVVRGRYAAPQAPCAAYDPPRYDIAPRTD